MLPVTIGSILMGLAILIVLGLFLARPFFKSSPQSVKVSQRHQLLTHKAAVLDSIRALDFDHDTGKLPDEEYERQRAVLMSDAAATLKALDEFPATQHDDVYAQIEAAIGRIKQQQAERVGAASHFCPNCGQGLASDDNFCARCGQAVYAVQPST